MPIVSANIQSLLDLEALEIEIDLKVLAQKTCSSLALKPALAEALFADSLGTIQTGTLLIHLGEVARSDSAVRDMLTTGHIAKLLSRWATFRSGHDYRVVGLPSVLFDPVSQAERIDYFARGAAHDMDGDLLDSQEAQAMSKREADIIERNMND